MSAPVTSLPVSTSLELYCHILACLNQSVSRSLHLSSQVLSGHCQSLSVLVFTSLERSLSVYRQSLTGHHQSLEVAAYLYQSQMAAVFSRSLYMSLPVSSRHCQSLVVSASLLR